MKIEQNMETARNLGEGGKEITRRVNEHTKKNLVYSKVGFQVALVVEFRTC